jgi:N-methylhydantoinase A
MSAGQRPFRIGIDVGGTFTDVVAISPDGEVAVLKVPSTPANPSVAVLSGLRQIVTQLDDAVVEFLGHGTTVGTNAFINKRGAVTALVTTAGFTDVLEFRRMDRTGILDPYDLQLRFPEPLVPARRRIGVHERVGVGGEVIEPLTRAEIDRVVRELAACAAESVAISLLWSFENPTHEQALKQAIENALPHLFVTCSHEIDPVMHEYERTSTTVVNAYLGPVISRYFSDVESKVHELGMPVPRIMQSNGGLSSIGEAARRPVSLLESGPAAGVAACAFLGSIMRVDNVLAIDMGGTSFDVALIVDGSPRRNIETEVDGYVVRVPMLDIRSIGAGGGSIAWIDEGGALQVGPQSAGAEPGPVCYGRGGTAPTVSDANAVLGYLQTLTGGSHALDVPAAARALETTVGAALDVDAIGAAAGVYRLVNAHMADAMRVIMSETATSPHDVTLMAYGGAGPVHAAALAREMEISTTIIPHHPGALSALGVGTGDLIHDLVDSVLLPLDLMSPEDIESRFRAMSDEGRRVLLAEGCDPDSLVLEPYFVARYIGQMHDLQVPIGAAELKAIEIDKIAAEFHQRHMAAYGVAVEETPVFIVSMRLRAIGPIAKPDLTGRTGTLDPEPTQAIMAWFDGRRWDAVPIFERDAAAPWKAHVVMEGPAIIQEYDSTIVVLPGQTWHIDDIGSTVIKEI